MRKKIIQTIANLALIGIVLGISITELSLGAKIINISSLIILVCVLETTD